jgi:hypothetical protein
LRALPAVRRTDAANAIDATAPSRSVSCNLLPCLLSLVQLGGLRTPAIRCRVQGLF